MATLTDGALWERTCCGESAALGELYRRHARSVHSYCLWRTTAKQLSEDASATVFLEAWRRRRRLDLTTESAAPLLLGIATQVLRNYWRIQRRHAGALERIGKADRSPWDEDQVIARVHAISEVREAGAAIRSLPAREREVLALLAWGALSQAETAAALAVPIETVRSRLARSRARLGGLAVMTELPDISPLLPDASTLEARRPVLEASCRSPGNSNFARSLASSWRF
jgi:RNA polymerase sigma factor (sigma-70 family)